MAVVNIKIDSIILGPATGIASWSRMWDTTGATDGIHTITAYGSVGDLEISTSLITSVDNTNPTISTPGDIVFEEGTTGHVLSWDVFDVHPSYFEVYIDDSLYMTAAWESEINITLDALPFGEYNLTVVIWDETGRSASDTVMVTVQDITTPVLSEASDLTYVEGTSGHTVEWTASDRNPYSWSLLRNGAEIDSGIWNIREAVFTISVDGLTAGTHSITLTIYDKAGNEISDTVVVTVEPAPETTGTTSTTASGPTSPTGGEGSDPILLIVIGVALGSVAILIVIIVMMKRRSG
ncbi:MAG: hypothetical protein P1Q69_01080 [Candidatus Thorarchaeota archaeon]|nr:hypothetical protein [Candidatus Thorarchaeota archaeon]